MRVTRWMPVLMMLWMSSACTVKPMLNVVDAPVPSGRSLEDVRDAILNAGSERGWTMREEGEGVIKASLDVRVHRALVEISYSPTSFSIRYLDSTNLDYEDGKIHRNYSRWVNNLRADIQRILATK